ncbi:type II and III secretion system protein family protein [Caballeronia sordidicola]|jgi:pilus assembly protein CpaC|uniref:Type II/IV secretion system secretin RcpA/CpaC, associated with Flp pilus assembly n=1 Tax=Caballeronia sordidicola TaxID=196367 RepID=A0A226X9H8_CABSO|nr:type II and III secretion system protein family protein [Caballeronia sordidicola]OXC80101.1 Type II/IV secretion system secretin RcpA/CpaC, associated with Flp pilus assembly [Caballeronia sordidicola]
MTLLFSLRANAIRPSKCALYVGVLILAAPAYAARPQPAVGSTVDASASAQGSLDVAAGKGTLVRLGEDATSVFVADPTIADVHVPSPRAVFVLGKKAGTTTLYVLGANNKTLLQRTIVVGRDMDALRGMVAARFPSMNLQLSTGNGSLQVSGQALNAGDADAVVQSLTPYLAEKEVLINRMTIDRPQQVQLRVRITEVDRNVTQQLGINWQAIGSATGNFFAGIYSGRPIYNLTQQLPNGSYPVNLPSNNAYSLFGAFQTANTNIQALVDALNQEGLITVLAEPSLVALSGQTASFLAGGEFPIPVSQTNGAISVEFKQFGVKLDFTPTVLSEGRISLKVRPEVSQIDTSVSVTTGGITVPGLSVRRADTTVELASGQSFVIGGLLQSNTNDIISQVPGLGSIPILGKLFSSTNYQNNKTELVIMVTPYLVEPTEAGKLRTPLESLVSPSNDVEYSFKHRASGAQSQAEEPRLVGAAGYVY